jgi:hypothetical protein
MTDPSNKQKFKILVAQGLPPVIVEAVNAKEAFQLALKKAAEELNRPIVVSKKN